MNKSLAERPALNQGPSVTVKAPALVAEVNRASELASEIHDSITNLISHLEVVRSIPPATPSKDGEQAPEPNNLANRLRNTNERLCMALSRISNLRNELDV